MIGLFLRNWQLFAVGGLLAFALSFIAWANHEHHAAQAAKVQAKVAVQAAQTQAVIAKATDQAAVKTVQIETRTHEVIRQIQAAPGADTPLPDAVRDAWLRGLSDPPAASEAHRPG